MSRIQNPKRRGKRCSWATDTREFVVGGETLFGTEITTATSARWIVIHDEWRVFGVVVLDMDSGVLGWMNPPEMKWRMEAENALREAFGALL